MSLLKQQRGLMAEPAGLGVSQGGDEGFVSHALRGGRMAWLAGLMLAVAMPELAFGQSVQDLTFDGQYQYKYMSKTPRVSNVTTLPPISVRGDFRVLDSDGLPDDDFTSGNTPLFGTQGGDLTFVEDRFDPQRDIQRSDMWLRFPNTVPFGTNVAIRVIATEAPVDTFAWAVSPTPEKSDFVDPTYPGDPLSDQFNTNRLIGDPTHSRWPIGDNRRGINPKRYDRAGAEINWTATVESNACGNAFVFYHFDGFANGGAYKIQFKVDGSGTWQDLPDSDRSSTNPIDLGCIPQPNLTHLKSASLDDTVAGVDGVADPGDQATYTFTLDNNGPGDLTNLSLADDTDFSGENTFPTPSFVSGTGTANATQIPEGESVTFEAIYTLTQADIDTGFIDNQAVANADFQDADSNTVSIDPVVSDTGTAPDGTTVTNPLTINTDGVDGTDDDPTRVILPQSPTITLEKVGTLNDNDGVEGLSAGDTIDYTFTITNTGNVNVSNIEITDPGATTVNGSAVTLGPGASDNTTYTATYSVTQGDIDTGSHTNTATATGDSPAGTDDVTANDDHTEGLNAQLTLLKGAQLDKSIVGDSNIANAGDEITYTFTLTNTGDFDLTNLDLQDDGSFTGGNALPSPGFASGTGGATATYLPVGESATFTTTYSLAQSDIDAGVVENQATVTTNQLTARVSDTSTDPDTNAITNPLDVDSDNNGTPNDDPTRVDLQDPSLALIKTADTTALQDPIQAGDVITYTFSVVNTGNVTLTNVDINDDLIDSTNPVGTLGTLAPGDTNNTITADYVITQADIEAGEISNTARATGAYTDIDGNPQTSTDDSGSASDNDAPTVTSIPKVPSMALSKSLAPADQKYRAVGNQLTYEITLENDGNITLYTSGVNNAVTDADADLTYVSGDTNSNNVLDVSETWTYKATYAVEQADLNNGEFINTAVANASADTDGNGSGDQALTATDSATAEADLAFITGRIFADNGLGGGIANDGTINGNESGLGGITVRVLALSSGVCSLESGTELASTVTTNGSGDWSVSLDADDAGTPACVVAETPTGFRAVSESAGTVLGTGNATPISTGAFDDDQMTFDVPTPGTTWQDVNFGKVARSSLRAGQQGTVGPNQGIEYRHRFTAGTAGTVDFALDNLILTPSDMDWSQLLRRDPGCDGQTDSTLPLTGIDVAAGDDICLVLRVVSSANAQLDDQHQVDLKATLSLDTINVTETLAVTDNTRVQLGQLKLDKEVRNLGVNLADGNDDVDSTFTTSNQANPCEVLRYRVTFTNLSDTKMAALEINDSTQAYTSLATQATCPSSNLLPANLSCTVTTLDGTNAEGYEGGIRWDFNGELAAGAQGAVSFDVRVAGPRPDLNLNSACQ